GSATSRATTTSSRWPVRTPSPSCLPMLRCSGPSTKPCAGRCSRNTGKRWIWRRWVESLGRHAQGSVQPDDLAVEHFVLEDVANQGRELFGAAEPRGKRHLLSQGLPGRLGESGQERRIEYPRRDRHDPNPIPGQLAGNGQGHGGDP